jgi:hypothetical protein
MKRVRIEVSTNQRPWNFVFRNLRRCRVEQLVHSAANQGGEARAWSPLNVLSHRLRKREDWTRNFRAVMHTTAYFGPVYYNDCSALPGHITCDPFNQFRKYLCSWVQCNERSNFWWKKNFPKGLIKKCHFFMRICHTKAHSTSHLLQWL